MRTRPASTVNWSKRHSSSWYRVQHVAAGEKGLRRNDAVDSTDRAAGGRAGRAPAGCGRQWSITSIRRWRSMTITPQRFDSIIAFCWRTSRPISRGSSEKICFLILRVKYHEKINRAMSSRTAAIKISDHFSQSNSVEIAGEVADGDDTESLALRHQRWRILLRSETPRPPLRMVVMDFLPVPPGRRRRPVGCRPTPDGRNETDELPDGRR